MPLNSAQIWSEFTARLRNSGLQGRTVILDSWQRSHGRGLHPDSPPLLRRISREDLEEKLAHNEALLRVAGPILESFSCTQSVQHVIYLTDRDAIVLYSVGDRLWMAMYGLFPGYDWSEAVMGTNGAGTALVNDAPVAVLGGEHYLTAFANSSCLASPIHGPGGELLGAVDFTTAVEDAHPDQLAAIVAVAAQIERGLENPKAA